MRLESLRTILALAAIRDFDVIQFNIKSAYLHRNLKEEVYMEQPEGYTAPGKEDGYGALRRAYTGQCRLEEHVTRSSMLIWRVRDLQ
jgi:hypothetical protein